MYDPEYEKDLLSSGEESPDEMDSDYGNSLDDKIIYSGTSVDSERTKPKFISQTQFPFSPPNSEGEFFDKIVTSNSNKDISSKPISTLLLPIFDFFQKNTNFDSMPPSSKVIVFDMDIKVNDALHIATENDVKFASLWDKKSQKLNGMLTVSDLVDILLYCQNRKELLNDLLVNKSIRNWREMKKERLKKEQSSEKDSEKQTENSELKLFNKKRKSPNKLVYANPEDSLWDSICKLLKHRIHRLPILSRDGSLLHVVTNVSLLTHLARHMDTSLPIFKCSLSELNIGCYDGVYTAEKYQKVFSVLEKFSKYDISSVPVVNEKGTVEDIFTKNDVVSLLKNGQQTIDCTIETATAKRRKLPLYTCGKNEQFGSIIRHLTGNPIHKLVCVDESRKVVGMISITDIFEFLLKYKNEINVKDLKNNKVLIEKTIKNEGEKEKKEEKKEEIK